MRAPRGAFRMTVIQFPNRFEEAEKLMLDARETLKQQLAIVDMLISNLRILRKRAVDIQNHSR
jgi:hypothetical protein